MPRSRSRRCASRYPSGGVVQAHNPGAGWGGVGLPDGSAPDWAAVEQAPLPELVDTIRPGGLANQKAPRIQSTLRRLREERGDYSLEFLGDMTALDARDWLTRIDGIGKKTASVLLLFSFGLPLMPVDRHVDRVAHRVGLVGPKASADDAHDLFLGMLEPDQMYEAHVNLIQHGRRMRAMPSDRSAGAARSARAAATSTRRHPERPIGSGPAPGLPMAMPGPQAHRLPSVLARRARSDQRASGTGHVWALNARSGVFAEERAPELAPDARQHRSIQAHSPERALGANPCMRPAPRQPGAGSTGHNMRMADPPGSPPSAERPESKAGRDGERLLGRAQARHEPQPDSLGSLTAAGSRDRCRSLATSSVIRRSSACQSRSRVSASTAIRWGPPSSTASQARPSPTIGSGTSVRITNGGREPRSESREKLDVSGVTKGLPRRVEPD